MLDIELFDYVLPPHRIAQHPTDERDSSRALFVTRGAPDIREGRFREIGELLQPGDCLVVNNTRVIPARIRARRATGGAVEVFLVRQEAAGVWRAWLNPSQRVRAGEKLHAGERELRVLERCESYWRVEIGDLELVTRIGEVPLPPYLVRERDGSLAEQCDADKERYQTLFAREPGAVAAPTAGLHFSESLLTSLRARGIEIIEVTLHVGPGTFQPIRTQDVAEHRVDPEIYAVSAAARERLAHARAEGRRVFAVGSTSLRVLESLADLSPGPDLVAETALTILPGHQFRHVDGLITNFHLPRSSLLVLVCSFHGREPTLAAYRYAIEHGLRFYSYGDAMVISPTPRADARGAARG